jgi:hypothetical protein
VWDPTGTIGRALWIGGGQWAGKSTVARLLAVRHGLTAYHYDCYDARGTDRRGVPRAGAITAEVSDPERAQRNRIARDRLLAGRRREGARIRRPGTGSRRLRKTEEVADLVVDHFRPYL